MAAFLLLQHNDAHKLMYLLKHILHLSNALLILL
jgi:hypothetical protein